MLPLSCLACLLVTFPIQAQVRINEIMYHPTSEDIREEYIELHNAGAAAVNLAGWQFSKGVSFTFPDVTLPPDGYLVVAADVDIFTSTYGSGLPVIGNWGGRLSNNHEDLDLDDEAGIRVDSVVYADEGDWGVRRRGPLDHNHRGWLWTADHDGGGSSTECISPLASNNSGQNWAASLVAGGTPGAPNSVLQTNIAPLIDKVAHLPAVPRSVDPVLISAEVADDLGSALAVSLHWREDGAPAFSVAEMFDDGAHDDGAAGDGLFAATVPPHPNNTVVEFYVEAGDAQGYTRSWPAPTSPPVRPLGQWSLDESSGVQAADGSGRHVVGILTDGAAFAGPGRFGPGAVRFADTNAYVLLEQDVSPPPLGASTFTLATWFRRDAPGTLTHTGGTGVDAEPLIAKGRSENDGGVDDLNYFLGLVPVGAAGNVVLAADFEEHSSSGSPGSNRPVQGTTTIGTGVWHHAAATYDGATWRLYLDGSLEATLTTGGTPNYESIQPAALGAALDSGGMPDGAFLGLMDEVLIADGALSADQIASLASSNTYQLEPGEQAANALFQVDDSSYAGAQPLIKLIMKDADRAELKDIGDGNGADSDAQMNATVITRDGTGTEVRYTVGIRNRGHGSRNQKPNNYRVNFVSDQTWQGVTALNINGRYTHSQLLGSVLALRSGQVGADARPVQVRVNNANLGNNGPQTYGGVYVANEAINSDWAEHWFPDDSSGNLYRALRDTDPVHGPYFDYRGTNWMDYDQTYFKQSNASENDWTDLIGMLQVMGENQAAAFTTERVRSVIDPEQWMLHLAVMSMLGNGETGLNSGYNDDYFMYRGGNDPRFVLMYYDLDSILGQSGSFSANTSIFSATTPHSGGGTGAAMDTFLHWPEFEPVYYRTFQHLLDTTFAKETFDATVDQVLGSFVPDTVRNNIKTWMDSRRAFVQAEISPYLDAHPAAPRAAVTGEPRSPSPSTSTSLTVGGADVVEYRYRLNEGPYSDPAAVATPIVLSNLVHGSTNRVWVVGAGANGVWQSDADATPSAAWVVRTDWPTVRINEVLARNVAALDHVGTFPDAIELFNEGDTPVDLAGLRLTDNPASPNKFTFPPESTLESGAYLVLYANNDDGTPGLHTGFSLGQNGEGVYLFDSTIGGRGLLDEVTFGLQLPDLAVGRLDASAEFVLAQPTFGAANLAQSMGDPGQLRINEWLASEFAAAGDDFVEIYNQDALPVAMGGCYLTDNPIGQPTRSRIAPLSFVAGLGMRLFIADGAPEDGNDHLAFRLRAEQGLIALLDPDLETIDLVSYGPQYTDVSEGRLPDGDPPVAFFTVPTPGAPNQAPTPCTVTAITQDLLDFTHTWRYNQTQNLDGSGWTAPGYDDDAWSEGPGLLYVEASSLPGPKSTPLAIGRRTYYFRTTFTMPVDPAGYELDMDLILDDGAIVYLNGDEVARPGVAAGTVTYDTFASRSVGDAGLESLLVPGAGLVQGQNSLAVEVHQTSANSSDVVWGMRLSASLRTTNCLGGEVVLNEVLAANRTLTLADGRTPDWVELLNTSTSTVDLAGMGLTDDPTRPDRWVAPPGTLLEPGAFLVVEFDPDAPTGADNTGFGLDAGGDAVYLYAAPAVAGAMVDSVQLGLQAPDFAVGRLSGSGGEWVLTLPTRGTANVAAGLGNASTVRLNEWMAAPEAGNDWFELFNPDPQPVAVSGLALTEDPTRRDQSPLPPLSFLGPGEARQILADNNPHQGADHAAFRLDADGDFVGLYWPSGAQVDSVAFGSQATGISEGRFPDAVGSPIAFPGTDSPGSPNYLPLGDLVINEVLSHTDPPWEDAVEIHNRGASPVDIGGWWLSNDGAQIGKFRVPSNTVIEAGGFRVFYENDFGTNTSPQAEVPFRFNSAHGDEVHLTQTDGAGGLTGYRATARFGAAANGVSFGRFQTSVGDAFAPMSALSFGVDNPSSVELFRTGAGAPNPGPRVGPVVISEIHYQPLAGYTADATTGEYIELRNITTQTVPLFDPAAPANTWRLAGGADFAFPQGLSLAAGETALIVAFDPASNPAALAWFRATYGVADTVPLFGPLDGDLANEGELIELYRPDPPQTAPQSDIGFVPQVQIEYVRWLPTDPWPTNQIGAGASLQRRVPDGFGNEPFNWFTALPSAHLDNLADSDGDTLPDYWESAYGLDPGSANGVNGASGDLDMDGQSNRDEFLAGTDPGNPADYLRIQSMTLAGPDFGLRFHAAGGRTYQIRYSAVSIDGPWQLLASAPMSANDAEVEIVDPTPAGDPHRFYQIIVPEQTSP